MPPTVCIGRARGSIFLARRASGDRPAPVRGIRARSRARAHPGVRPRDVALASTLLFLSIMRNSSRLRLALVLGTGLMLSAQHAFAEPSRGRTGGTFGVGLGVGHIGCEDDEGNDCDGGDIEAGGLSLRAGAMLGPGLALVGEAWAMRHDEDSAELTQAMLTAQVRGWLAPRLWLQGGLGVARTTVEYDYGGLGTIVGESDVVPALAGSVGVEVLSDPGFALDLELKGGTGLYEDDLRVYNASIGVGISFY